MTRHARNCTASSYYTYHEKKKDAAAAGYGTESQRLGKDSINNFDCCCLSLQPCRNPCITRDGYLFDKEAILEYIIKRKSDIKRKIKLYEKQQKKEEDGTLDKLEKIADKLTASASGPSGCSSVSNMADGRDKSLPSFWVPYNTPDAKMRNIEKPKKTVYCPMSGKPLKMKDLIDVKFTQAQPDPDDKNKHVLVKKYRYVCAVTRDVLTNAIPTAVIATTGDVVTVECVEKIIKPSCIHPLTGEKLNEKDIIYMQRGGTGYSQTNSKLEAKNERPALQV